MKRAVIRTLQVAATLGIAQAVPCFDKIVQLLGSSTVMLLTFIFPPIFRLRLAAKLDLSLPLHVRVMSYEIIIASFLVMLAGVYSAVKSLIGGC